MSSNNGCNDIHRNDYFYFFGREKTLGQTGKNMVRQKENTDDVSSSGKSI